MVLESIFHIHYSQHVTNDDAQVVHHCSRTSNPEGFTCSDTWHVPERKWTTTEPSVRPSTTLHETGKDGEDAQHKLGPVLFRLI
jgi:hypothetical protein